MPFCKLCNEEINFISMKTGKKMPVNIGKIILHNPETEKVLITEDGRAIRTKEYGATGYEPHWSTCPYGQSFRRAKSRVPEESKGADGTKTSKASQATLAGFEERKKEA